jgi:DNA replication and repair protein RecF
MILEKIEIKNVRSLSELTMNFIPGTNLIYGKNGTGKTSVLEAIHSLSISKSFRQGYRNNLQQTGSNVMEIIGTFNSPSKEISFRKNREEKRIHIGKTKVEKLSELIGIFPSVVLSPEDIDIASGGNNVRLKFINKLLSVTDKKYLQNLTLYKKNLKQRNKAIAQKTVYNHVEVWDETLSFLAEKIWGKRKKFIHEFVDMFDKLWISALPELEGDISYKPSCVSSEDFLEELKNRFPKDTQRGQTSVGPQKDMLSFSLDGKDIKNQASQGEKKFFLTILKLAEAEYIEYISGKKPALLLDDLFAKLDKERGERILGKIDESFQAFITTTDASARAYFKNPNNINFIALEEEVAHV